MLMTAIEDWFKDQDDDFKYQVFEASILYCIRQLTAFEYQKRLSKLFASHKVKTSVKEFRMELSSSSWFLLNIKYFCMSYSLQKLMRKENRGNLKKCIRRYSIKKPDFLKFVKFLKSRVNRTALSKAFSDYIKEQILTVDQARAQFYGMYIPIHNYCKAITYKKLRFIVRSNNLSPEDMHCELMTKAIRAFYSLVPSNETELYILNYVKRAVHNHAMNIIKQYTFGKRDRLKSYNDNTDFVLSVVSENQFKPSGTDGEYSSFDDYGGLVDDGYRLFESKRSCHQMYKRQTALGRKLLRLVFGEYDAAFTSHLHKNKVITKNKDNVSFYENNIEQYKVQAFQFLDIDYEKGNDYLKKLYRQNFGDVHV